MSTRSVEKDGLLRHQSVCDYDKEMTVGASLSPTLCPNSAEEKSEMKRDIVYCLEWSLRIGRSIAVSLTTNQIHKDSYKI